jgi:tetratricopeptide (TPR) repeat protein
MTRVVIALVLVLAAAWATAAPSDREMFVTQGIVLNGGDTGGAIWFELYRVDQRFILERKNVRDPEAVFAALKASSETGRSITVHYYAGSGDFGAGAKPIFVVARLVYDGRTIEGSRARTLEGDAGSGKGKPQPALARAVALYGMARGSEALGALDEVIAGGQLPPKLQALALKTRGGIRENEAFGENPPGDARDRLLVAALADFRTWRTLAPDDSDAAFAEARTLLGLGAYGEALAAYEALIAKWPGEYFWASIRIASMHRTRGEHAKALEVLDELGTREGAQDGMPFHYHRGRTLNLLGRYDEAIAEFTAGLRFQPDYFSALLDRACSFAQSGRLREALADQESALAFARAWPRELRQGKANEAMLRRANEVERELRAAIRRDERAKLSAPCDGYWDFGEAGRARSALLPASAN